MLMTLTVCSRTSPHRRLLKRSRSGAGTLAESSIQTNDILKQVQGDGHKEVQGDVIQGEGVVRQGALASP